MAQVASKAKAESAKVVSLDTSRKGKAAAEEEAVALQYFFM